MSSGMYNDQNLLNPASGGVGYAGDERQWLVMQDGQQTGPFHEAYVQEAIRIGMLPRETKACPAGTSVWRELGQWPAFSHSLAARQGEPTLSTMPQVAHPATFPAPATGPVTGAPAIKPPKSREAAFWIGGIVGLVVGGIFGLLAGPHMGLPRQQGLIIGLIAGGICGALAGATNKPKRTSKSITPWAQPPPGQNPMDDRNNTFGR